MIQLKGLDHVPAAADIWPVVVQYLSLRNLNALHDAFKDASGFVLAILKAQAPKALYTLLATGTRTADVIATAKSLPFDCVTAKSYKMARSWVN
jgi:hypothetical protein